MENNILSPKDIQVINSFIDVQSKHLIENKSWYHPSYLKGFDILFKTPFSIERFEQKLSSIGWVYKFVDGYISSFEYFKCLGNKILPVINKVRDDKQLLYADFPDTIHDVIGHSPMLFDENYTMFLKNIYNLISSIKQEDIDKEYLSLQGVTKELREKNLSKLTKIEEQLKRNPTTFYKINNIALFSVEFGVLLQNNSYKAYGAAVVASPLEISNIINKKTPIKNLLDTTNPSFNFSDLQNELYATKNLDEVIEFMLRSCNKKSLNRVKTYLKSKEKNIVFNPK